MGRYDVEVEVKAQDALKLMRDKDLINEIKRRKLDISDDEIKRRKLDIPSDVEYDKFLYYTIGVNFNLDDLDHWTMQQYMEDEYDMISRDECEDEREDQYSNELSAEEVFEQYFGISIDSLEDTSKMETLKSTLKRIFKKLTITEFDKKIQSLIPKEMP